MSKDFSQIASDEAVTKTQLALEKNGFTVIVVDTLAQAKDEVLKLVPEDSEVFTGTSETLNEAGLTALFNESGKYDSVRKKFTPLYSQPDRVVEMKRIGSGSEYTVGSVHAITEDGTVMVASASGSQLPNYVYGASHVVWVVGTQKLVKDLNEAFERLETYTFPLEDKRALEAYGSGSTISKVLLYKKDHQKRVTIVLFKEAVGY